MGNCLNCIGSDQQDNTNLLTSSTDTALASEGVTRHENLRPSFSQFNQETSAIHYPTFQTSERHLQCSNMSMNHSTGIGVAITSAGSIIQDEEQQIRMAKRMGLIQHLPTRAFDGLKKGECVICMMELLPGEEVRYLPCMHTYHASCIDDWLLRSLTCPTCMEPVDAALINSYHPIS